MWVNASMIKSNTDLSVVVQFFLFRLAHWLNLRCRLGLMLNTHMHMQGVWLVLLVRLVLKVGELLLTAFGKHYLLM